MGGAGVAGFGCKGDILQSEMTWGGITGAGGDVVSSPRLKLFSFSVWKEGN